MIRLHMTYSSQQRIVQLFTVAPFTVDQGKYVTLKIILKCNNHDKPSTSPPI